MIEMGSPPSHSVDLVRVRVRARVRARAGVRARVRVAQRVPASRAVVVLSRVSLPQGARQVGGETRG